MPRKAARFLSHHTCRPSCGRCPGETSGYSVAPPLPMADSLNPALRTIALCRSRDSNMSRCTVCVGPSPALPSGLRCRAASSPRLWGHRAQRDRREALHHSAHSNSWRYGTTSMRRGYWHRQTSRSATKPMPRKDLRRKIYRSCGWWDKPNALTAADTDKFSQRSLHYSANLRASNRNGADERRHQKHPAADPSVRVSQAKQRFVVCSGQ